MCFGFISSREVEVVNNVQRLRKVLRVLDQISMSFIWKVLFSLFRFVIGSLRLYRELRQSIVCLFFFFLTNGIYMDVLAYACKIIITIDAITLDYILPDKSEKLTRIGHGKRLILCSLTFTCAWVLSDILYFFLFYYTKGTRVVPGGSADHARDPGHFSTFPSCWYLFSLSTSARDDQTQVYTVE